MVCLILLAIQLVRVSFLQNTKDQKPSLVETLISDEKDVICEGTVYKIENKNHHQWQQKQITPKAKLKNFE